MLHELLPGGPASLLELWRVRQQLEACVWHVLAPPAARQERELLCPPRTVSTTARETCTVARQSYPLPSSPRPQRFDIEDAALEARFKRLQQAVHPDLFGSRSAQEQAYSAQASADVNVAYQTLRSPVSRAQYLLQLHGRDAIGETVGSGASDPALLMRVMEARELLEDAHAASEAVQGLLADVDGEAASALARLSEAFAAYDLDLAARLTVELQYLTKLALEAREWLAVRAEKEGSSSNGSP